MERRRRRSNAQSVIESSVGDLDEMVDDGDALLELHRVDELGSAESFRPLLLVVVGVDSDNSSSVSRDGTLDDGESDSSESEDSDGVSRLNVGGLGTAATTFVSRRRAKSEVRLTQLRNR